MVDRTLSSFDSLTLRAIPNFKVRRSTKKRVRQNMQRLDLWGIEAGMALAHVDPELDHVAFRTKDGVYIGIYDDARFSISAEIKLDQKQVRRIDAIIAQIISRFTRIARTEGTYQATIMFHVLIKSESLKRFIRASTTSAQSSFIRAKLGAKAEVRGLITKLEKGLLMSITVPNDIDYSANIRNCRKGFLYSVFSDAIRMQKELAGS